MTPEQILALLQIMADLRSQLGLVLTENAALRAELCRRPPTPDGGS